MSINKKTKRRSEEFPLGRNFQAVWFARACTLVIVGALALGSVLAAPMNSYAQPASFVFDGTPDADANVFNDPFGSIQELGPVNGTNTKLGVIDNAVPPMLSFTNPNGQTDLVKIWLKSDKDSNGDVWLYFAWQRDATSGSSVISYEVQRAAPPTACNFDDPDVDQVLPQSADETTLINNCNPWANRAADDFLIVWDFQGGATDIILRTFVDPGFDAGINVSASGNAVAVLNSNRSAGEGAVNLSKTVFDPDECFGVGNIIPGTITGNSDQADYKDTVLIPNVDEVINISNCGTVIIRKQTGPDGADGEFTFTSDLKLIPPDGGDSFNLGDDDSITFDNVKAPGSYVVTESDPGDAGFDLTNIDCSESDEDVEVETDVDAGTASFTLEPGETVDCTFTNTQRGKITIEKVCNDDDPTQQFSFTSDFDGGPKTLGCGESKTSDTLGPGAYSVSETEPAGWNLVSATCDDGSDPSAIDLSAGEEVTCTFTNEKERGAIKITKTRKHAASGSGNHSHAGVTFTINGEDVVTDATGVACLDNLLFGDYTVTETVPAGYVADGDVSKTVTVSTEGTCTSDATGVSFSNTPLTNITVSVDSQVNGGTASTITCIKSSGSTVSSGSTGANGDGSVTASNLLPDTYTCTIVVDP